MGLPLPIATERLQSEGFLVRSLELRSRKGLAGNENRVIRQRALPQNTIELVYASFKTDLNIND